MVGGVSGKEVGGWINSGCGPQRALEAGGS